MTSREQLVEPWLSFTHHISRMSPITLYSIPIISLIISIQCDERIWSVRNPRYLPFPVGAGNKLQVITGFGIPVDLKDDSVTFGLILKTNYELPTNATQFTNPAIAFPDAEFKRTRWDLYSLLESAFERLSIGGRDCILRSICQAAFTAFENNGLFGEILEILFLPSRTNEVSTRDNHYVAAERLAHYLTEEEYCVTEFPECPTSLLDIITTIENNEFTENIMNKLGLK